MVITDETIQVDRDVVSSLRTCASGGPTKAEFSPVPGAPGRIGFDQGDKVIAREQFTVVDAIPKPFVLVSVDAHRGAVAAPDNSYLVTFELEPAGEGTLLRLTESGFRERGWAEAKVATEHASHVTGWDFFLSRSLGILVCGVLSASPRRSSAGRRQPTRSTKSSEVKDSRPPECGPVWHGDVADNGR